MRDELAERVFDVVMGPRHSGDTLVDVARPLQAMALYKYDEYGGYSPGVKFMESLACWLNQMEPDERQIALQFVQEKLIFVSEQEIQHALSIGYRDFIRPDLLRQAASECGLRPHAIEATLQSEQFKILQRSTLFLGLADGARLDQFRRANKDLVHDQFAVTYEIEEQTAKNLLADLKRTMGEQGMASPDSFRRIVLVDDFSGSGYTMLRYDEDSKQWKGKLAKVLARLERWKALKLVAEDYTVQILLYVCTEKALNYLKAQIEAAGWHWSLRVAQILPMSACVDLSSAFADLCRKYHDEVVDDQVKIAAGSPKAALGFNDSRLAVVLTHNTPNNSVGLLWQNTVDEPKSAHKRYALFPRHERHKADR